MPWHKEIIAYDIASQEILWTNKDLTFLFAYKNIIYGFKHGFEERYFFSLDFMNGEIIEEIGNDFNKINILQKQAESEENWDIYVYPKIFSNDGIDQRISDIIKAQTDNIDIAGDVEYNIFNELLFFNYHKKILENKFENKFAAVDISSGKVLLSETLNARATSLFTDSFFVYKKYLFLLHEKNKVIIYKLE